MSDTLGKHAAINQFSKVSPAKGQPIVMHPNRVLILEVKGTQDGN